jgi:hypothetical protein
LRRLDALVAEDKRLLGFIFASKDHRDLELAARVPSTVRLGSTVTGLDQLSGA